MLGGAVTGKLAEARSTGVFALDPRAVKALVDETNTASSTFGEIVTAMLAKNPSARIAAQDVERALATGASVVAGGAAIIEEDEEDEAIAAATEQRRAAEVKAAEERRQRLAAEAKTAEAERKLRAAEATAAEEKKQREAAAAAEAEQRRRAAAAAKAAEEKKQREAAAAAEAERRRRVAAAAKAAKEKKQREAAAAAEAERRRRAEAKAAEEKRRREAEDVDPSKLPLLRTLQGHSSHVRRAASACWTAFVIWVFVVGHERCGVSGRAVRRFWVVRQHACPVPLTVRGTQALVGFAPLAPSVFCAARQNAVLRRSPLRPT